MKKCLLVILFNLFLVANVFSQSESTDGFINYTVGNKWKYESRFSDKEFTTEITECTETDTLTTCQVENFGELIVQEDSVFITDFFSDFFSHELSPAILKYYMADFPIDSVWDACWDCSESEADGGGVGFITDTTSIQVFDEPVLVKTVVVKYGKNDPLGVPAVQLEIAEKFGIISIQYWHGDALVLTGAVIEGEAYGDLIVSNEHQSEIPKQNKLLQNYPNPFNPTTTISYQMEQPGQVSIKLYTITGQLVKELLHTHNTSGTYGFQLNGDNLSSGMYILRGKLGEYIESRTITLIK